MLVSLPITAMLPTRLAYALKQPESTTAAAAEPSTKAPPAQQAGAAPPVESASAAEPAHGAAATAAAASTEPPPASGTSMAAPALGASANAPRGYWRRVSVVLRSRHTLLCLALLALVAIQFSTASTYLFLYAETVLGASGAQLGLVLTASAVLEVPLFQVASPLIQSLGMLTALLTCQLTGAIRFVGWISVPSTWHVLPFETMHGYMFAISYSCTIMLGEQYAPLGLQATVLGITSSISQIINLVNVPLFSAVITAYDMRTALGLQALLFAAASAPLLVLVPMACRRVAPRVVARRRGSFGFLAHRRPARLLAGKARRSDDVLDEQGAELPVPPDVEPVVAAAAAGGE